MPDIQFVPSNSADPATRNPLLGRFGLQKENGGERVAIDASSRRYADLNMLGAEQAESTISGAARIKNTRPNKVLQK